MPKLAESSSRRMPGNRVSSVLDYPCFAVGFSRSRALCETNGVAHSVVGSAARRSQSSASWMSASVVAPGWKTQTLLISQDANRKTKPPVPALRAKRRSGYSCDRFGGKCEPEVGARAGAARVAAGAGTAGAGFSQFAAMGSRGAANCSPVAAGRNRTSSLSPETRTDSSNSSIKIHL